MSTEEEPAGPWTILFKDEQDKVSQRLTPDGSLTRLTIHAAMIRDREYAESVAAEIREKFPKATVRVARF